MKSLNKFKSQEIKNSIKIKGGAQDYNSTRSNRARSTNGDDDSSNTDDAGRDSGNP